MSVRLRQRERGGVASWSPPAAASHRRARFDRQRDAATRPAIVPRALAAREARRKALLAVHDGLFVRLAFRRRSAGDGDGRGGHSGVRLFFHAPALTTHAGLRRGCEEGRCDAASPRAIGRQFFVTRADATHCPLVRRAAEFRAASRSPAADSHAQRLRCQRAPPPRACSQQHTSCHRARLGVAARSGHAAVARSCRRLCCHAAAQCGRWVQPRAALARVLEAGLLLRRSEAHAHRFRALVCCSGAAAEARVPEVRFPSPKRRVAAAARGRASSRADKVARAVAWPRRARHAPPAAPRRQAVRTHVVHRPPRGQSGEWPEAGFVAAVRAALPAHGACGAEAARVLYADGHAFLDVRSSMELDTEGKLLPQLPGVVHVPFITFAKRIDAATGRKCVDKMPNAGFLAAAARALPDQSRGVVVVCSGAPSQGVWRADAAADVLRAAGYARVVVLSRGYAVRSRRAPVSSSLNRSAHIAQESNVCTLFASRRTGRCASRTRVSGVCWATSSQAEAPASSSGVACRRKAVESQGKAWTRSCVMHWPRTAPAACIRTQRDQCTPLPNLFLML